MVKSVLKREGGKGDFDFDFRVDTKSRRPG
jgi:hypothetical protein